MPRDYKKEYARYQGKPDQKTNRAARGRSRYKLEQSGRVKKGDGKDVHHRDGNPRNTKTTNLRVLSKATNRSKK